MQENTSAGAGKRKINGRQINPVGLGCMPLSWAYGAPPSELDSITLLNRALDIGYDHLDTANIYGLGHNETLIAKALASRRQEYLLASKMGIVVEGPNRGIDCSPAAIHRCIDESLTRLKTDHVDLYYMHRFDPKVPIADMMGAMAELKAAGKIGAVGVSEWSAAHIREAHAHHPIAAVQTEYSPWTRNPEIAVLDVCAELGITFVAFSPVGRGALAGAVHDPQSLPEKDIRRTMPRFTPAHWPHNLALLGQYSALAAAHDLTVAQLSLAWVQAQASHIVSIPGTTSLDHLAENIAHRQWQMPADICAAVDEIFNQATVSGPRYGAGIQASIDTEEFAA
jgi:aryl-alcohol dehydrogenase-like predicted oxidoreductase